MFVVGVGAGGVGGVAGAQGDVGLVDDEALWVAGGDGYVVEAWGELDGVAGYDFGLVDASGDGIEDVVEEGGW